jgi:hypothetical protein
MKFVFNPFTGNLDAVSSSASEIGITLPLTAANGGTGVANGASASLTLPNAATTITGGGTLALGGFTLTVPATGTVDLLGTAQTITAHKSIGANGNVSNPGQLLLPGDVITSTLSLEEEYTGNPTGLDYIDGLMNFTLVNPSTSSASTYVYGIDTRVYTKPANNKELGALVGVDGTVWHRGDGAIAVLTGLGFFAVNSGAGAVNSMYGISAGVTHDGTGLVDYVTAISVSTTVTGSSLGVYGLWIDPVTGGSDENYAIYTNAGNVRFGGALQLANYTSNGFVKTSGGNGTLTIDTASYASLSAANTWTAAQFIDGSADAIQLRVQANATQTTNPAIGTFEKSDGTVFAKFNGDARIAFGQATVFSDTEVCIWSTATNRKPLAIRAITGQTATLLQFQDNSGNELAAFKSDGSFQVGSSVAGSTFSIYNSTGQAHIKRTSTNEAGITLFNDTASSGGQMRGLNAGGLRFTNQGATTEWAQFDTNGNFGVGVTPAVRAHYVRTTTTANAVLEVERVEARVSTASTGASAGFGASTTWYGESATDGNNRQMGQVDFSWATATDASRKARGTFTVYDTAAREAIRIEASGTAAMIGLYGVAAVAQQAGIADADGTLADITTKFNALLAKLETLGAIGVA